MRRLRIKIRKTLWLTLSAVPEQEKVAVAMFYRTLATIRQDAHVRKTRGNNWGSSDVSEERRKDGKTVCSLRLTWIRGLQVDQVLDLCDWVAPIVFEAWMRRDSGAFSVLREALDA